LFYPVVVYQIPLLLSTMKNTCFYALSCIVAASTCSAFVVKPTTTQRVITTSLEGGFTDGKAPRITIRDDEDAAMWVEEPAKKKQPNKPASPKKAAAKKPVAKKEEPNKPTASSFKFPWQK
jgi:hypothetical protein